MKVAVVTGATRGIGNAIANSLQQAGYTVVYAARSANFDGAEHYISCDVSDTAQRKALLAQVLEQFGRVDLLVNNAGVAPAVRADLLETTEESFDRLMAINLKSTFFMCQNFANAMIQLKDTLEDYTPRIINIASISSYVSSTSRGEYCVSKAGISMTTQLFADRLAQEGIAVFEIRPGIILTDMTRVVEEKHKNLIEDGLTPIKRFGMPQDVANCVLACAGGLLDFATGQVLNADGGYHIRRL